MILIISNSVDLVEPVTNTIREISSEEVVIFRSDKCLAGEGLSFVCTDEISEVFLDVEQLSFDLSAINKAWFYKPMLPKALREYEPHQDAIFIYRQFLATWRSLTSFLRQDIWLNDYYRSLEAENKPYQLKIARNVGFKIPDTLITTNPDRATKFWQRCEKQMVIKALAFSPFPKKVVFTNQMTDQLMAEISRIKSSPVILQKLIPGKQEYRITVVGNEVYTAAIQSNSPVDWRRGLVSATPAELPLDLQNRCVEIVKTLGLRFGCIDMIQDENGDYYFLEINPNGQWRFVEEQAGLPIGESIARLLVSM